MTAQLGEGRRYLQNDWVETIKEHNAHMGASVTPHFHYFAKPDAECYRSVRYLVKN